MTCHLHAQFATFSNRKLWQRGIRTEVWTQSRSYIAKTPLANGKTSCGIAGLPSLANSEIKSPNFSRCSPSVTTHSHIESQLTKQLSSHMPGYAIEREKYTLWQMSLRLDIILRYCWLAFIQMCFSFYKEADFRFIDVGGFVSLEAPHYECRLMNSEVLPISMCGVNKEKHIWVLIFRTKNLKCFITPDNPVSGEWN